MPGIVTELRLSLATESMYLIVTAALSIVLYGDDVLLNLLFYFLIVVFQGIHLLFIQ